MLVYRPIREALDHKQTIILHRGVVALPACAVCGGLVLLLAGKHSPKFVITRHDQKQTPLQWAITGLAVALCLALEFGLYQFLGYTAR